MIIRTNDRQYSAIQKKLGLNLYAGLVGEYAGDVGLQQQWHNDKKNARIDTHFHTQSKLGQNLYAGLVGEYAGDVGL